MGTPKQMAVRRIAKYGNNGSLKRQQDHSTDRFLHAVGSESIDFEAPKRVTEPKPFNLLTEERGVFKKINLKLKMETEQKKAEEARIRRATLLPFTTFYPVIPKTSERPPPTQVEEFTLHVETRAGQRREFENKLIEKEKMYKKYKEERAAQKKKEEEEIIRSLRKEMVPTARPVPLFNNPFLPKKSSAQLTKPKSPKFSLPRMRDTK